MKNNAAAASYISDAMTLLDTMLENGDVTESVYFSAHTMLYDAMIAECDMTAAEAIMLSLP